MNENSNLVQRIETEFPEHIESGALRVSDDMISFKVILRKRETLMAKLFDKLEVSSALSEKELNSVVTTIEKLLAEEGYRIRRSDTPRQVFLRVYEKDNDGC